MGGLDCVCEERERERVEDWRVLEGGLDCRFEYRRSSVLSHLSSGAVSVLWGCCVYDVRRLMLFEGMLFMFEMWVLWSFGVFFV